MDSPGRWVLEGRMSIMRRRGHRSMIFRRVDMQGITMVEVVVEVCRTRMRVVPLRLRSHPGQEEDLTSPPLINLPTPAAPHLDHLRLHIPLALRRPPCLLTLHTLVDRPVVGRVILECREDLHRFVDLLSRLVEVGRVRVMAEVDPAMDLAEGQEQGSRRQIRLVRLEDRHRLDRVGLRFRRRSLCMNREERLGCRVRINIITGIMGSTMDIGERIIEGDEGNRRRGKGRRILAEDGRKKFEETKCTWVWSGGHVEGGKRICLMDLKIVVGNIGPPE